MKRVPSIVQKLIRFSTMSLARMQDIGGCRAVVPTVKNVRQLHTDYLASKFKHALVNEKDYINSPKESGYRGIHLIYRYRSDKNKTYNGHLIEIQIRSQLQHAWATAVETMGLFLEKSLKSSEGPEDWLKFFELASSAFSYLEDTPPLHTKVSEKDIAKKLKAKANKLNVFDRLRTYGDTLNIIGERHISSKVHYYLLSLMPDGSLMVKGYLSRDLEKATSEYLEQEKKLKELNAEVVLVAAESFDALRSAYPNYFLDTQIFLEKLELVIS